MTKGVTKEGNKRGSDKKITQVKVEIVGKILRGYAHLELFPQKFG
jgi:hypothetical protein